MNTQSLWRSEQTLRFPRRPFPNEVDVVVVGGGITGLTAALLLKRSGKRVALFEREQIGSGETGNTSAHLTYVTDTRLSDLVRRFGKDGAASIWEGGARAIDFIETLATGQDVSCAFRRVPGFLCSPFFGGDDATASLKEDAELARELGFDARFIERGPLTSRPAVGFSDQAIFHPLRYLSALARLVDGDGSFVFEQSEVAQVLDDPRAVIVNGETIACTDVVIATHVPIVGSTGLLSASLFQTKLYPYSSYVLGARIDSSIDPGLYDDTSDPYFYLRVHDDEQGRYAVFGGEDHKTGQAAGGEPNERFASLERALLRLIPSAQVQYRWTGQVIETSDGLPFIGKSAEHQWIATGYAGNGLTFGTLAGMMLHDAVVERSNKWSDLLDPARKVKSPSAIATLVRENLDYPLHLIADRLRVRRNDDISALAKGDGIVVRQNGKSIACHRTDAGEVLKVSAVCTHLGCLVRWNGADRTWDCPCHGSRFTPEGLVLGGPAESPLEKVED